LEGSFLSKRHGKVRGQKYDPSLKRERRKKRLKNTIEKRKKRYEENKIKDRNDVVCTRCGSRGKWDTIRDMRAIKRKGCPKCKSKNHLQFINKKI
jgi:shikimate kinase